MVGLCTGLLAATAITSAPSLSVLIYIATEFVLVAFRLGIYIDGMADQLDTGDESSRIWTYIVPDIDQDATVSILHTFHTSRVSIIEYHSTTG